MIKVLGAHFIKKNIFKFKQSALTSHRVDVAKKLTIKNGGFLLNFKNKIYFKYNVNRIN